MFVVPIAIQNGFTHFDFEAFSEDTIKVGIDFVNTPNSKTASNFHRKIDDNRNQIIPRKILNTDIHLCTKEEFKKACN